MSGQTAWSRLSVRQGYGYENRMKKNANRLKKNENRMKKNENRLKKNRNKARKKVKTTGCLL